MQNRDQFWEALAEPDPSMMMKHHSRKERLSETGPIFRALGGCGEYDADYGIEGC